MYDIKQVVKMTNIKRNKIYKLIKENEELKKFVVRDNKKIYILEDGIGLLINNKEIEEESVLSFEDDFIEDDMESNEKEEKKYDIVEIKNTVNEEILKSVLNQLKEKDKQIQELLTLNKNNQILLREEKEVNKVALEAHFKEVDTKLLDLREKMNSKKSSKKRWWFFLKKDKL